MSDPTPSLRERAQSILNDASLITGFAGTNPPRYVTRELLEDRIVALCEQVRREALEEAGAQADKGLDVIAEMQPAEVAQQIAWRLGAGIASREIGKAIRSLIPKEETRG